MIIKKIFDNTIALEDDIQTAALLNQEELVILTTTGKVLKYNINTHQITQLFETNPPKGVKYSDGGFVPSEPSTIYTLDHIVVVVNDYGKHGFVVNFRENYKIHFSREDYYANISKYPIALFYNEEQQPLMIFAVAWNRVEIVNLATRQVLTAGKSLIEESAERDHLALYDLYEEHNKFFWPSSYDYFFGGLALSPDHKTFASAGWMWGSFDCCKTYDIADFIANNRIKDTTIGGWEHKNRSVCFVDNDTVAILYNPGEEGEPCDENAPYEIHLYKIGQDKLTRIPLQSQVVFTGVVLTFNASLNCFLLYSEMLGVYAISLEGEVTDHDSTIAPQIYSEKFNCFICYQGKQLSVYKL